MRIVQSPRGTARRVGQVFDTKSASEELLKTWHTAHDLLENLRAIEKGETLLTEDELIAEHEEAIRTQNQDDGVPMDVTYNPDRPFPPTFDSR